MVKTMILSNVPESMKECDMKKHLQSIQKTVGGYNMFVAKAIIDHSDGVEKYFDEVVDLVEELVISVECDVIVLDNSFGYEMTEEYKRIKNMADEYNVSIYHYEDMALYMPEENEHFDYDSVPFEVFELKLADEEENDDLFAAGILEACHSFEEKVKDFPLCERNDAKLRYADRMIRVADVLLKQSEDMQNRVRTELENVLKIFSRRKGE